MLYRPAFLPLAGVGIAIFGYATFSLGNVYSRSLQLSLSAGYYPAQELLVGVLTDPMLFVMLLLIRGLPWAWEIVPLFSPEWLMRAGSLSSILRKVLLPLAIRQSVVIWLLVYAIAGLVVAGGWLATGLLPAQASVGLVLVLWSQFARGVLVFVLAAILLGLAAMASPKRLQYRTTAAVLVLLWLALFVLSSMPDLVPDQINAITLLSAGAEQSLASVQVARPAQLSLALMVCVTAASIVDALLARARGFRLSLPSANLWLALGGAGLLWALSSGVGLTVAEFYSGYRGTLMGAVAEVSLTLGPAVFVWVATGPGSARGWNTVVALRAGTYAAGLLTVLRNAFVSALKLWVCVAIGTMLGILALGISSWSGDSGGEFLIIISALIGGLLQMLLYLVILITLSFLTSSQWPSIVSVVLLAILPPPGMRIEWLPLHAAFDSLLVQDSPAFALRNTLTLAFGLLVTVLIGTVFAVLRDLRAWERSSRK